MEQCATRRRASAVRSYYAAPRWLVPFGTVADAANLLDDHAATLRQTVISADMMIGIQKKCLTLNTVTTAKQQANPQAVARMVWSLIEDADSDLPEALRPIFAEACREIREIEARVKQVERQLEATAEQLPAVGYLRTIPGIGLLIATALVAFIGDIRRFPSGRHFASYLGLTPREYSSGLKRNLGRISKRGDGYLRTLLIHGARSVLLHARQQQPDRLREWANNLGKTHVHNKAAVAVANKPARIVWAVWSRQQPFVLIAKAA